MALSPCNSKSYCIQYLQSEQKSKIKVSRHVKDGWALIADYQTNHKDFFSFKGSQSDKTEVNGIGRFLAKEIKPSSNG